ncbi:MAG: FIST signal transduction protein [Actinomycetota bacterium]
MQVSTLTWTKESGWRQDGDAAGAQLVVWFAAPAAIAGADPHGALAARFPNARIVGCSTGGEIAGEEVVDASVSAVAMQFASARIEAAATTIDTAAESEAAGRRLADALPKDGLRSVFVLADGMRTNGTALVAGLRSVLPEQVLLTGGLAGDGADFKRTLVGCDGTPAEGVIAAVGFYGDSLRLGWGSFGGWDKFGPERVITRSQDNVLYELDGEPALALYKRYLGEEAARLPGSALLFPLTVRRADEPASEVVRTIVGIDEANNSMVFAGDVPQGWVAQLMRGHFDGLIDGAGQAGERAGEGGGASVALLISCIGRKLLMGQRITDEVEAAAAALGDRVRLAGFYSYGEIAPHGATGRCELHNQTMTITAIGEA